MAQVKTPDAREQIAVAASYPALRVSRDLAHRARKHHGVAALGLNAPLPGAGRENIRDIHLRGSRQTETRH